MTASKSLAPKADAGKVLSSSGLSIIACIVLSIAIQFGSTGSLSSYAVGLVFQAAIFVTLSVSLNIINGITGQFSIGHFAFFQIGAYTTGAISKALWPAFSHAVPSASGATVWIILMMVCGTITAGIAGWVVGLPSLRLRGDYLAIVTLGFGEIIRIATENISYTNGAVGLNIDPPKTLIWAAWLLAFACIGLSRNLLKSVHGLAFLSIREDEIAATAMGVNITKVKVAAFVIGSAFAGAAGVLYAHQQSFISPDLFKMEGSFIVLTMVIFGGTGSITGSALAGASLFYLPEILRELPPSPFHVLIGIVIGLIITIAILKKFVDSYFGPKSRKAIISVEIIVGGLISMVLFGYLVNFIPGIRDHKAILGSQLRMVVFSVTLIILMLFRPQGVFAQHEFSWKWFTSLFRLPKSMQGEQA